MPRVKVSVGDLTCTRQADKYGKDDVYWLANLRQGTAVDAAHTNMAKLIFDTHYDTSLPEMVSIGAGETSRFSKAVIYDKECAPGSYVFGTLHFMERDTPLANYFSKILGTIGVIIIGLLLGAAVGVGAGYGLAGLQGAIGGGVMVVVGIIVFGFIVGAAFDLVGGKDTDAHLGGMRIVIGPLSGAPPDGDKESWPLTMTPAGRLDVVDVHGAELTMHPSSHVHGPASAGHKYDTSVQLEITGGARARVAPQPAAVSARL
jgi:hypothetical protein